VCMHVGECACVCAQYLCVVCITRVCACMCVCNNTWCTHSGLLSKMYFFLWVTVTKVASHHIKYLLLHDKLSSKLVAWSNYLIVSVGQVFRSPLLGGPGSRVSDEVVVQTSVGAMSALMAKKDPPYDCWQPCSQHGSRHRAASVC
jgi:hypothetical protein